MVNAEQTKNIVEHDTGQISCHLDREAVIDEIDRLTQGVVQCSELVND